MNCLTYRKRFLRGLGPDGDGVHAVECDNLYISDGNLIKRHGYRTVATLGGAVRGLHLVDLSDNRWLLAYAGQRFYLAKDDGNYAFYDITLSGVKNGVDVSRLRDTKTRVFCQNNRAYIVGCGDYLVLGYYDGTLQLRRVAEDEDTYVPTTSVAIGSQHNALFLPATVDDITVGDYYYLQDGDYVLVHLDGDTSLPQAGVQYYRLVQYPVEGTALDRPNMLTPYRINTLYGSATTPATYLLDAGKVDADSATKVQVTVLENGTPTRYTLLPVQGSTVTRAPVVGDDLGGKTLHITATSFVGVGTLHLLPTTTGIDILHATGGSLVWVASGPSSSDWDNATLVMQGCDTPLATACRSSWRSTYTVTWIEQDVTFPADFGVVQNIRSLCGLPLGGALPTLSVDLAYLNTVWGNMDLRKGTITFTHHTTPPDDQPNIVVTYKSRSEDADDTYIGTATVAATYGVGGNADRLFVGGNDYCAYADYHSESGDFTYFTPASRFCLGEAGRIVGYLRRGEMLVTFLQGTIGPNAYWRNGSWNSFQVSIGAKTYTLRTASFAVSSTATLPMAASAAGYGSIGSDDFYLSSVGLYRVLNTMLGDENKVALLSAPIDKVHWGADCICAVCNRRIYISDGSCVYVGDSRYQRNMYGSRNYEWTRWTLDGVTAFLAGDDMMLGTSQGKVRILDNDYCDVDAWRAPQGTLALSDSRLVRDATLDVACGDRITLDKLAYAYALAGFEVVDSKFYVDADAILRVFEGDSWYVLAGDDIEGPYTVAKVDWGDCTFVLQQNGVDVSFENAPSALLVRIDNRPLVAVDVMGQSFALALSGTHPSLAIYHMNSPITASIQRGQAVEAKYTSEYLSMSTPETCKQLLGIALGGTTGGTGTTVGVRTTSNAVETSVLGLNTLNFDWLDLDRFAFDGTFHRVYRAQIKQRFHYMQWRLCDTSPTNLSVDSVSLQYRYLHTAKGEE